MRIAIAGSGPTGANIGAALAGKDGVEVKYASRDPTSERISRILEEQVGNSVDSVEAALQWANVVIVATPSMEDDETIKAFASKIEPFVQGLFTGSNAADSHSITGIGPANAALRSSHVTDAGLLTCKTCHNLSLIQGKVVLDSTNPLSPQPAAEWRWRQGTSCGEVLAASLPEAYVYKGFNSLGQKHLSQGAAKLFHDQRLSLLFAGPPEKRDVVAAVISAAGFRPCYVGGIRYARNLEVMAELWHHLALPSWGSVPPDLSVEWGYNFHFQVVSDRT